MHFCPNQRAWLGFGAFLISGLVFAGEGKTALAIDFLRINEIMYAPVSGEPEWIELQNSGADTLRLQGWSISDAAVSSRHLFPSATLPVPASGYLLLTGDTSALLKARPGLRRPLVQIAGFPSLNNTGDFIHLFNASGVCNDSVEYLPSWGGAQGKSIERIDAQAGSMDAGNWASSVDSTGATPGAANSMARKEMDLASIRLGSEGECTPERCELLLEVRNAGRQTAAGWSASVYDDVNRDGIAEEGELICDATTTAVILPGDSAALRMTWDVPVPGHHLLCSIVHIDGDQQQNNDRLISRMSIPFSPGIVKINEVMYEPLTGMPEFVEITNVSRSAVDLEECVLSDRPTVSGSTNRWGLSGRAYRVLPAGFLVVIADTTGPEWFPSLRGIPADNVAIMHASSLGLNNLGDLLVLHSSEGAVLDSVAYSPASHSPDIPDVRGRSLERINPQLDGNDLHNWGTCVDPSGGTPGVRNSIALPLVARAAAIAGLPNPFSPDADGHDDVTIISYVLPVRSSMIRIRVFDVCGRVVRELANVIPAASEGQVVWDGRDDGGHRARIGIYIVMLEAIDGTGGVLYGAKCAVVLAAQL